MLVLCLRVHVYGYRKVPVLDAHNQQVIFEYDCPKILDTINLEGNIRVGFLFDKRIIEQQNDHNEEKQSEKK